MVNELRIFKASIFNSELDSNFMDSKAGWQWTKHCLPTRLAWCGWAAAGCSNASHVSVVWQYQSQLRVSPANRMDSIAADIYSTRTVNSLHGAGVRGAASLGRLVGLVGRNNWSCSCWTRTNQIRMYIRACSRLYGMHCAAARPDSPLSGWMISKMDRWDKATTCHT